MSSDYEAPNIDIANVEFFPPYKWEKIHPPFRSIDLFKNERRAYSRLKARGFCERGTVPDFYGVVENIDPEAEGWQPHLKKLYDSTFPRGLDPQAHPNGVLMEYIPDVNMFDISNYTEERSRKLHQLLIEIHEAGIVHLDHYPRNMLIQDDSDHVLLIDYELAQMFDPDHPDHPRFFKRERELMDEFVEALVIFQNLVDLEFTADFFCNYRAEIIS
ncbi:hypothetical protein N7501_007165 [Penicillium viridicatum]|nr:hypothetical protein N7501_007165 [Penicillium viridicatum]